MSASNQGKLLGPTRAAELLQVGPSTIQRWIDAGYINAHRTVGGHRRIWEADLRRFARERGIPLKGQAKTRNPSVVIVDDEEEVHVLLEGLFSQVQPDVTVCHAMSGFEAGIEVARNRPEFVFLDIRMPGVDGIRVCTMIKANPVLRGTRVIGITGTPDESEVEELLSAGAEEVIRKPFDLADLKEYLAELEFPKPASTNGETVSDVESAAEEAGANSG